MKLSNQIVDITKSSVITLPFTLGSPVSIISRIQERATKAKRPFVLKLMPTRIAIEVIHPFFGIRIEPNKMVGVVFSDAIMLEEATKYKSLKQVSYLEYLMIELAKKKIFETINYECGHIRFVDLGSMQRFIYFSIRVGNQRNYPYNEEQLYKFFIKINAIERNLDKRFKVRKYVRHYKKTYKKTRKRERKWIESIT